MRIRTLLLFLIGNRQAILDLAANRRAVWIGLLFVLSAGFAREYDGQDLLDEPWHVVIPVGASLAASFLLFLVLFGRLFIRSAGDRMEDRPPFWNVYRSFLTLFWMTAPLAWFYAIPYERFLAEADATRANLWSLTLVAAWRVLLMIRVSSVLTGRSVVASTFLVMAFADVVALIAVSQMPKPVISLMGGVRQTESEQVVAGVTIAVFFFGILSAPLWGIGALAAFASRRAVWNVPTDRAESAWISRGVWALAISSLLIWLPILPFTQSEHVLRTRVERALKAGRIAEALDVLSSHQPSDFPPGWSPPPRIGYGENTPKILDLMEVLVGRDHAPWVRAIYARKLHQYLGEGYTIADWRSDLPRVVRVLQQLPEGPAIAADYRVAVESRLEEKQLPPEERESLNALLTLAK